MKKRIYSWPLLLIAAIAVVFVFGCIIPAASESAVSLSAHMYESGFMSKVHDSHHRLDHMDISLSLPVAVYQITIPFTTLFLIGTVYACLYLMYTHQNQNRTRWRKRLRRHESALWQWYAQLFRVGILNPKLH